MSASTPNNKSSSCFRTASRVGKGSLLDDRSIGNEVCGTVAGPNSQFVFDLASILTKRGHIPQAIERYRQVIELDPSHADAWNNLGILLGDAGDLSSAREAFQHALRLTPADPKLHYNLADLLDSMALPDQAMSHWGTYLSLDRSDSPWAEYARGRIKPAASY